MNTQQIGTVYTVFQRILQKDFNRFFDEIKESPKTISYSNRHYSFLRRAYPGDLAIDLPNYFDNIFFNKELSTEKCSNLTGSLCILCFDNNNEVSEALELFKLAPNCIKYIVLIPRITTSCQELIDRSGLDIRKFEFPLEIVPMGENMFLVPSPYCFSRCYIESDITDIYTIARSLLKLQVVTGSSERIFYAGEMSNRVFTLLQEMKNQFGYIKSNKPQFNDIFIIDRTADLITPLISQSYYPGILDDFYDFEYGYFTIPEDLTSKNKTEKTEIFMSEITDYHYKALKKMNIQDSIKYINEQIIMANTLKDQLDNRANHPGTDFRSITKRFIKFIDNQPNFNAHAKMIDRMSKRSIKVLKDINEFELKMLYDYPIDLTLIKHLINTNCIIEALRLTCFASLVSSDEISTENVNDIHRRIVGHCGFKATTDLMGLEKSGLFDNDTSFISMIGFNKLPKFKEINKVFRNFDVEENNEQIPSQDIKDGYNGYAPILHRIVQHGIRGDWDNGSPVDKLLTMMKVNPHHVYGKIKEEDTNVQRKVLVFVIGGVTQTEISLFAKMGEKLYKNRIEFHVGSTEIITGTKLIKSVCPNIASKSIDLKL